MSQSEHEEAPRPKTKGPWRRPTLTVLGHVKDLVQADGKVSGGFEGPDARKSGTLIG